MFKSNYTILGASVVAISVLIAGCGGGSSSGASASAAATEEAIDVSDASIVGEASKTNGGIVARSGNAFSFPEISDQGGTLSMKIPGGPLPSFPARRTVVSGGGQTIGFGDSVILKYDMFAWSNGELVESTSQFGEAITVRGGISDGSMIPEYLANSLLGRSIGDTVQVVLPVGTEDLPSYLDDTDAYVLVVELM